jgi:hypothetical protein
LVSAINHNGHPRISENQYTYPGPLEENQPPIKRTLNAVTSLLVRNHDIVTTAVSESYSQVLALHQPEAKEGNAQADLESQDHGSEVEFSESDTHESESESEFEFSPPAIVAITNHRNNDHYPSINDKYLLLESGTCHIQDGFGNWDSLLNIP